MRSFAPKQQPWYMQELSLANAPKMAYGFRIHEGQLFISALALARHRIRLFGSKHVPKAPLPDYVSGSQNKDFQTVVTITDVTEMRLKSGDQGLIHTQQVRDYSGGLLTYVTCGLPEYGYKAGFEQTTVNTLIRNVQFNAALTTRHRQPDIDIYGESYQKHIELLSRDLHAALNVAD